MDRHLRYFTPLKELPIAGHPTVAAWIALVHEGDVLLSERTTYVQKTQPGVQTIDISPENGRVVISMQQQEPQFLDTASDRALAAQVFGLQEDDLISDLPVQAVDWLRPLGGPMLGFPSLLPREISLLPCFEMGVEDCGL